MHPDSVQPSDKLTDQEPVVAYQAAATLLALAAGAVGVVLDPSIVVNAVLVIVGFGGYIVAAIKARKKVTPVA